MDTTKPTITEVKFVDAQTIKITFSESLDTVSAELESYYTVKDSTSTAVSVLSAVLSGTDSNIVTLTFDTDALSGGSYTVEVKGVKDLALVKNIMDAYTATLAINDTVKPVANAGKYVIDNATDATNKKVTVYIPFSEAMDPATIVKGNFLRQINGAGGFLPLGTNDTVTLSADGKSVTLVLYNGATNWTAVDVTVGAVKDVAGNGLLTFVATPALTPDAIAVEKVEAISRTQIKVTFNGKLSTINATGYSLVEQVAGNAPVANTFSVASHTVSSAGKSVVVFNLGTNLAYDVTSNTNPLQLKVASATGTKSFLGTVVTDTTNTAVAAAFTVKDKVVPVVSSVTYVSATEITVTFTEKIEAGTLALTVNGFSVSGGAENLAITAASIGTAGTGDDAVDATTITLTGTGFVQDVTAVSYNSVAGLTDVAGNAIATFTNQIAD